MPTTAQVDVKVVYTASKRRRKPIREIGPPGSRPSKGLLTIGVINILLASAMYAGTWWWADSELRVKVILNVPVPGIDMNQLGDLFGVASDPPVLGNPAATLSNTPLGAASAQTSSVGVFIGTFIAWEIVISMAAAVLALSGGAILGLSGGQSWRRRGMFLTLGVLIAFIVGAYWVWSQYGIKYRLDHLRWGVGLATLWALCLGLAIGGRVRGLTFVAAIALILAAGATTLGLYIGLQFEAFHPTDFPWSFGVFAAAIFAVHSLWGWILLPVAARMRM